MKEIRVGGAKITKKKSSYDWFLSPLIALNYPFGGDREKTKCQKCQLKLGKVKKTLLRRYWSFETKQMKKCCFKIVLFVIFCLFLIFFLVLHFTFWKTKMKLASKRSFLKSKLDLLMVVSWFNGGLVLFANFSRKKACEDVN